MTEPITATTPRPVRPALLAQRWREVTLLHWPVPVPAVAQLFPPGTRPDTIDGTTYVGLVPFRMEGVLGLPYLGHFCETNVRLYSVDEAGRRGVVFLSLDAARLLPATAGRLAARLPYVWSAMSLTRSGDAVTYTCRRRDSGLTSHMEIQVGAPIAEPTKLEDFLTARWGLHVSWHGRTLYLPNEHPRWPLHRATLRHFADSLVNATGVVISGPPVSVLHSPGVHVRFGPPLACSSGNQK